MENKNPTGITNRRVDQLKAGDYVVCLDTDCGLSISSVYKIDTVEDYGRRHRVTLTHLLGVWFFYSTFQKVTEQEYIVAKLKGKLYE